MLFTTLILVDPVSKWGKSEKNTNKAKKKKRKEKRAYYDIKYKLLFKTM